MTCGRLDVPGGCLVFDVAGDGPPVVLVHGFGLDMRMWEQQLDVLTSASRVLRYDCRGFGRSGPYSHHDDLLALLDHVAMDAAALVGLSFGGRVVLQTALVAPSRVRGLALLDAVLDNVAWDDDSAAGLEEVSRAVAAGGVEAGRMAWMAHPLFATARIRPELLERLEAMVNDFPGQHWLGQDAQLPFEPAPIDRLDTVDVPTLVVVGDDDVPCFREMADILAAGIPGATYNRVRGAGHMVNMEAPEVVNRLLVDFLTAVSTSNGAG
jgi:3-oxoadipate enol-lactonase